MVATATSGILDPHVDVAPTDDLLAGHHLVLVLHLPEPGPVGPPPAWSRHELQGWVATGRIPHPIAAAAAVQRAARSRTSSVPDLAEVGTDRRRHLDLAPVQLGRHPVAERARAAGTSVVGTGDQLTGRPIDDLELLFHAEGGAVHGRPLSQRARHPPVDLLLPPTDVRGPGLRWRSTGR